MKSLSGRVFLVLLLGIMLSAGFTLSIALNERENSLIQSRESHFLERAAQLVLAIDGLPNETRPAFMKLLPRFGMRIDVNPDLRYQLPSTVNSAKMADKLGDEFHVTNLPPLPCPSYNPITQTSQKEIQPAPPLCENIAIMLHDGSHLSMILFPPKNPIPPLNADFYPYLGMFLMFIAALAFFVARMTIRPLQKLSQAAIDLGNDINHAPLAVVGATELRQATTAFNAMQARIRTYINQRTHMLAAITHDLQTPLTRLRLRIEKVDDNELRERLISDLSSMQDMVREGLMLARSMDNSEARQVLNLDSLIDSVVSNAIDAGQPVTLEGTTNMSIKAQPQAISRCLNNLIDNALKYGRYANVIVSANSPNIAVIKVRDGGSGIPEIEIEKVFTPFYRLETSRSRESGGTGLGLTIARNIIEQHGGSLTLANHPQGGLEATLTLPSKLLRATQK